MSDREHELEQLAKQLAMENQALKSCIRKFMECVQSLPTALAGYTEAWAEAVGELLGPWVDEGPVEPD